MHIGTALIKPFLTPQGTYGEEYRNGPLHELIHSLFGLHIAKPLHTLFTECCAYAM